MGTILLQALVSASDFGDTEDVMRGGHENDGEKNRCVQYLNTEFHLDFFFFLVTSPPLSAEGKFL